MELTAHPGVAGLLAAVLCVPGCELCPRAAAPLCVCVPVSCAPTQGRGSVTVRFGEKSAFLCSGAQADKGEGGT